MQHHLHQRPPRRPHLSPCRAVLLHRDDKCLDFLLVDAFEVGQGCRCPLLEGVNYTTPRRTTWHEILMTLEKTFGWFPTAGVGLETLPLAELQRLGTLRGGRFLNIGRALSLWSFQPQFCSPACWISCMWAGRVKKAKHGGKLLFAFMLIRSNLLQLPQSTCCEGRFPLCLDCAQVRACGQRLLFGRFTRE